MHIILMRHGESENNALLHHEKVSTDTEFRAAKKDDPDLTEKGRDQAFTTGEWLRRRVNCSKNTKIWVSPLQRSLNTAILAFPGEVYYQIDYLEEYDRNKEDLTDCQERVEKTLGLIKEIDIETLILVGHSLHFSLLISRIISDLPSVSLVVEFPNCSLTDIEYKNGLFSVYQVCKVDHMSEELQTAVHTIY